MGRLEKVEMIRELSEALKDCGGVFMISFSGINANDMVGFRGKLLKEAGAACRVVKNRLAHLSMRDCGELGREIAGQTMAVFSQGSAVSSVAKILTDFADSRRSFHIKGGLVDGKVLSPDEIDELSALPSFAELRARLLRGMLGSAASLSFLLAAPARGIVGTMEAIKEKDNG